MVAISVASHWAVWLAPLDARSASGTGPGMAAKCIANVLNVLCAPGWGIVHRVSGHWHTDSLGAAFLAASLSWTGWFVGLAMLGALRRAAAGIPRSRARAVPASSSRRRFLFDGTLGLGCASTLAVGADATLVEPWDLRVTRYDVPIAGLPASLVGLKLVQLSDTHLGPRIPASFIRDVVTQVLALAPDIVLLTGDYVHDGPRWIEPAAELFQPLVAPGRVAVGVLGNHDWWAGGQRVTDALTRLGVRMVDNARCFYDPHSRSLLNDAIVPHQECLCLAGLGDLKEDHVDFIAALSGVPESMPRLVLAHRPDTAELPELHAPRPPRIDLMLCGHTHGGQVRLPIVGTPMVPSRYGSKYAAGLVQGPACRVLISRGVGMSILPLRFGVPPEIVEITLTRAPAAPNNPA